MSNQATLEQLVNDYHSCSDNSQLDAAGIIIEKIKDGVEKA